MAFTSEQRDELRRGAEGWGVVLDDDCLTRFSLFAERLEETNRTLNLTRVPLEQYVSRHFLDSLALASVLKPRAGAKLIDVGTGAGFPGVPLALAFPLVRVTLLDSALKRLGFLDAVLAELGIGNARTLHARAEDITKLPAHRAKYDFVTARAVAKLPQLCAWSLPLLRPGGLFIAYKSEDIEDEIAKTSVTLAAHRAVLEKVVPVSLPETDIVRKFVLVRKR